MKAILFLTLLSAIYLLSPVQQRLTIEILQDEARELLDEDSPLVVIGSEFMWTEGPLHIQDGNYLLVSDIPRNKVYRIDANGQTSEYLFPSGFMGKNFQGEEPGSNGLLLNQEGQLVLLQHGERRIAVMNAPLDNPEPVYSPLADRYNGRRFNSPNDAVFDRKGNLYFTDPIYGLPERADDPARELDFCGVYCLTNSGKVLLLDTLSRPNGIALSPEENRLYVSVSDPHHATWYRYDINKPGKVKHKKLFFDVTDLVGQEGQPGLPDGMAMHSKGYLFASGPGGIWIFNSEGIPVARIHTGKATSNCTFSADEKRLFITADDVVLRLDLK